MRRGTTLLEALIATVVGMLALAAVVLVLWSVRKMEGAGNVASALQEAALAMSTIQEDLSQAVQKPDPKVDAAVMVKPQSVQLLRGILKNDGTIDAKLVEYRKEKTPAGNFRLLRRYGGAQDRMPGLYRAMQFDQLDGPGGPFVRVTLRVATADVAAEKGKDAGGLEETVLTALVRVQGPEMAGSKAFGWSFLSLLKLIPWLPF
jgi:hypothetical protein